MPLRLLRLVVRTVKESLANDVADRAAALAYYQLLCAMPLVVMALAGAAWVVGSPTEVEQRLVLLWRTLVPGTSVSGASEDLRAAIRVLVDSSALVSGLSLFGLLMAGSRLFTCLESAMNRIWDAPRRPWWRSRLLTLALTLGVEGALCIGFGISVLTRLDELSQRFLPEALRELGAGGVLAAFLVTFCGYLLIFRWLPNRQVSWRSSLVAAGLCAAAFEAARIGFGIYVDHFANYNVVFGSLGGLFMLMLWAYAVGLVTLVGAEVGSVWEEVMEGRARG